MSEMRLSDAGVDQSSEDEVDERAKGGERRAPALSCRHIKKPPPSVRTTEPKSANGPGGWNILHSALAPIYRTYSEAIAHGNNSFSATHLHMLKSVYSYA